MLKVSLREGAAAEQGGRGGWSGRCNFCSVKEMIGYPNLNCLPLVIGQNWPNNLANNNDIIAEKKIQILFSSLVWCGKCGVAQANFTIFESYKIYKI